MKKILLFGSALFMGGLVANAQCDYSIDGADSWGDGWNGGSLAVTSGGVPVTGSPFSVSGASETWTFSVNDAETIELTWSTGSFDNEVSYVLRDSDGNAVHTQATGVAGVNFTGTTSCPACASPTGLALNSADDNSASFTWDDPTGIPEWQYEYGTVGFAPGTGAGTQAVVTTNAAGLTGLTADSFFEFYVRAICTPGADSSGWVGPFTFNTYNQGQYMVADAACPTGGYVDISGTGTELLGLTDDGSVTAQALPFPVLFQGVLYNTFGVNNNGGMILGNGTPNVYGNASTKADGTLIPWGDDLDTETGAVYTEVQGVSPNQVFIVQFHERPNFSGSPTSPTISFQVQIEEATSEIYFVYDDVIFGAPQEADDYGANADITVSGPNSDIDVSNNDATYLMNNTCAHFYYTNCPPPTNVTVSDFNNDSIMITWAQGGTETMWDVNYGPVGFDPATAGTTSDRDMMNDTLDVLTQLTSYDIYVRSDCGSETSQWFGPITQMTGPNCDNPLAIVPGYVAEDTIEVSYVDGSSGAATSFNLQYGPTGFEIGAGTVQASTMTPDTIMDAALMGSVVYDVYVQADCGTPGDTSQWIGPISVAMPLANDSTCDAITIAVDGSVNVFNNSGATNQTDEVANLQPALTGDNTDDGWDQAGMDLSTWFKFAAPASGIVEISTRDNNYDGKVAVYEVTDCGDVTGFNMLGANDNGYTSFFGGAELTVCGLTPGTEYYLVHCADDNFVGAGDYSLSISEVAQPEAGTGTDVTVCAGEIVDLNALVTGASQDGTWEESTFGTSILTDDTLFAITGILAYTTYEFENTVTVRCAMDSVIVNVTTVGPSNAGVDTTLVDACLNGSVNLFDGLSGAVDLGGTWYDATDNALSGNTVPGYTYPTAGAYNFTYIVSNGYCPNDTSEITVVYQDCLGIDDFAAGELEVYPNPSNGIVNIANNGNGADFTISIEDLRGRVVYNNSSNMSSGSIETVDLTGFDSGIYIVNVKSDEKAAQYKVVLK